MRLVTLGVGAQNSPCHAPAGLLISCVGVRVMIDGGPGAEPGGRLDAWLITDERAELIGAIRKLARARRLVPYVGDFRKNALRVEMRPVVHTSHPTCGYRLRVQGHTLVWAPEFYKVPRWARGADIMFAEGAAWSHPIRFAGGVGGHMDAVSVAQAGTAVRHPTPRLRPHRTSDAPGPRQGLRPQFGEVATDGQTFTVGPGRG
jgi:hypothetical protein